MNEACERDALLRELPSPWAKDPGIQPAVEVTGPAGAVVLIEGSTVIATGGTEPLSFSLVGITIGDMRSTLAATGITTKLLPPTTDSMGGTLLLPTGPLPPILGTAKWNISKWNTGKWALRRTPPIIYRWSNPTFRIIDPLAASLGRETDNVQVGLDQLNLLDAATYFADLWGTYLGVPRLSGEDDATYTARQRWWTIRPRENNQALAALLEEDFPPLKVSLVDDLVTHCFEPSDDIQLRYRPLRGWRYNIATIEIVVSGGFPSAAFIADAERNVAGGVKVYVRGEWQLDSMASPAGYDFDGSSIRIGRPLPIQIDAPPTIGSGKIGPP